MHMIFRIILLFIFFFSFSYSSFQEVSVGKIDDFYKDKITKEELIDIIKDIEYSLETQLDMNIFDYSSTGKSIDIVYISPSKLERRITKKLDNLKKKKIKIDELKSTLPQIREQINYLQEKLDEQSKVVNSKIKVFNDYVFEINKKRSLPSDEYYAVKSYVNEANEKLNTEIENLKKEQKKVRKLINSFNQKIHIQNSLVSQYNQINKDLESMNRAFTKVKGMTFGKKETIVKTYIKDGKKFKEETIKNITDKIEIYGFESKNELKAIIAHEIAHLVGIPHIEETGALLNPVLQKNQIEDLYLTDKDIENFKIHF